MTKDLIIRILTAIAIAATTMGWITEETSLMLISALSSVVGFVWQFFIKQEEVKRLSELESEVKALKGGLNLATEESQQKTSTKKTKQ
jgi:4-hydroxybenzoate polyprenyltransferase